MGSQEALTLERLRELLDYDPETGVFHWREDRPGGMKAGQVAGCVHASDKGREISQRRWQIVVDRVHYKAHRLAWFYVHGYWPEMIDHINGDACDNRLANLREAEPRDNMANSVHPKGATGFRGVSYFMNGYMAQISVKGKSVYLGRYRTAEEAHKVWCEAARRLRGDFTRTD